MPKVSVIMSVYNGSDYLSDAIESILSQTFRNFELILIDDGSKDDSWKILKGYESKDNRIVLLQNKRNIGLTRSLNKGLRDARGLYVARQDHDDVSLPLRLEKQVQFLDTHPSTILISSNFDVIDGKDNYVKRKNLSCDPILVKWNLIFYNYIEGHSQVMFRRKPVMSIGGYAESVRYAQDYDLWRRLFRLGKIAILPEVLLKYRIHNKRLTHLAADKQFESVLIISANIINELTGQRLDKREVRKLWVFWCLVHKLDVFHAKPSTVLKIHKHLKAIFTAFISEYGDECSDVFYKDVRLVRHEIGKRYFKWCVYELTKRRDFICSMIMFAGFIYWLRFDLMTSGFNKLRHLCNRMLINFG